MKKILTRSFAVVVIVTLLFGFSTKNLAIDNNLDNTNGAKAAVVASVAEVSVSMLDQLIRSTWASVFNEGFPVWRLGDDNQDSRELLIRYDDRNPDDIFSSGFAPRNIQRSIYNYPWNFCSYVLGNFDTRTPFVSTSRPEVNNQGEITRIWIPRFEERSDTYYRYEIFAPGGIDANESMNGRNPYYRQHEITFPGGIRSEFIRSAREVRVNRSERTEQVVRVIINPNFMGPSNLPEVDIPEGTPVVYWENNNTNSPHYKTKDFKDMMKVDGDVIDEPFPGKKDIHRPIIDGEYVIQSKVDNKFCVDLSKNQDGALIHAYNYKNLNNQQWKFTYNNSKKAYKISSLQNSNLLLTWDTNSRDRLVRGYNNNDFDDKYWRIEKTSDGYYKFRNLNDVTYVLDLKDEKAVEKNPIQMSSFKTNTEDMDSQKWRLSPKVSRPINDGTYKIQNAQLPLKNINLSNDNNHLVNTANSNEFSSQLWVFTYNENKDAYKIKNVQESNLSMTWDTNSKDKVVRGFNDNDSNDKYWRIEKTSDGYYQISNLYDTDQFLSLNKNFDGIEMGLDLSGMFQKWIIGSKSYAYIDEGEYIVSSKSDQDNVLDLSSNSSGSNIHAHDYFGGTNQKWKFTYDNTKKAYKVSSVQNSNLLMSWDWTGDNTIKGFSNNNLDDKFWRITLNSDGFYNLRNIKNPEKMITIADADALGGRKIEMNSQLNNDDQKWAIINQHNATITDGNYVISQKSNYKKVIDLNEKESKLMMYDYLNLKSGEWTFEYDKSKNAYQIHSSKYNNKGLYFQNIDAPVSMDNIDSYPDNDLRKYWTVEYNAKKGGYIIKNLLNQNVSISQESSENFSPIYTKQLTYDDKQVWNLMPISKK